MNIFVLDKNPTEAAKNLSNIHITKMFLESCQMLACSYKIETLESAPKTQSGNTRKHGYPFHPCTVWSKKTHGNHLWLLTHAIAIEKERLYRRFNPHFSYKFLTWCINNKPDNLDSYSLNLTDFALAMDSKFIVPHDPVASYRNYYMNDKIYNTSGKFMMKYTRRDLPSWFTPELKQLIKENQ